VLQYIATRGNNRQAMFKSDEDYAKILGLIERQMARLRFSLYPYCLMPTTLTY
jgi:hypothetical protein